MDTLLDPQSADRVIRRQVDSVLAALCEQAQQDIEKGGSDTETTGATLRAVADGSAEPMSLLGNRPASTLPWPWSVPPIGLATTR
jgi:hypothetical protein